MRVLTLFLVVMLVGCATVTGGARNPKVTVTSTPAGASVVVDGEACGVTPALVELSRHSEHKVQVTAAGCETATVTMQRNFNPWVLGNVLVGGIPGLLVDVCTDATWKLSPDEMHLNLKPLTSPAPAPNPQ